MAQFVKMIEISRNKPVFLNLESIESITESMSLEGCVLVKLNSGEIFHIKTELEEIESLLQENLKTLKQG